MEIEIFPANALNNKSLVEQIYEDIEKKIIKGMLKPGQRITEIEVCQAFGVSQTPTREAFRVLESRGFVIREPRKGIKIAELNAKQAEDIYHIRSSLESLSTYLAVKNQNPNVIKELKQIQNKLSVLAEQEKVGDFFDLNIKFHKTLINASENERLIKIINDFFNQTLWYRYRALSLKGRPKRSINHHEEIIRYFETGNAEKAKQLREKHILSNIPFLCQILMES